jgi:predicted nucleic acid-binding protein
VAAWGGADRLITLDTSSIVSLANVRDRNHARTVAALAEEPVPYIVPSSVLAEAAYVLESRVGMKAVTAFLLDLDTGALTFDCGERDFARIAELALRYDDLPLGVVDAGVIACAERNGGRVLTLDRRHFDVVGREVELEVLP